MASSPTSDVSPSATPYRLYPQRWYIILVYSAVFFMQGYIWNQWGPIYASVSKMFNWNNRQPAILSFYGSICYSIFVVPSSIALERFGLRRGMIGVSILVLFGTVLRVVPFHNTLGQTVLIHISAIANGIAGCVTWYAPAAISARWFGPHEHKLATALGTMINFMGVSMSFIGGPLVIPEPSEDVTVNLMRNRYFYYTWAEAVICLILVIMIICYYPDKPPSPPCASAEVQRIDYKPAIKSLIKSKDFWLLLMPFLFMGGTYQFWITMFPIIIKSAGVDEDTAGWIGFWSTMIASICGLICGKVGDLFGNLKAILIALAVLGLEGAIWMVLIANDFISYSTRSIWLATIILSIANTALLPMIFEMSVEILYPIDESAVVAVLGVLVQIMQSIFLVVFFIRQIPTGWSNWFLAVGAAASVPLMMAIPERYRRSRVDSSVEHRDLENGEISSRRSEECNGMSVN